MYDTLLALRRSMGSFNGSWGDEGVIHEDPYRRSVLEHVKGVSGLEAELVAQIGQTKGCKVYSGPGCA